MSNRYSIAEARSQLPTIVDQAEAGVEVQLTRRGKPVAAVIGLEELARLRDSRQEFSSTYREFLRRHSTDVIDSDDVFSGVRDRGTGRDVSL
ncbi:MAG: type II toxin-antitoxin system Phd/YefM family antitoxin [Gemmatimonadota bacterium]